MDNELALGFRNILFISLMLTATSMTGDLFQEIPRAFLDLWTRFKDRVKRACRPPATATRFLEIDMTRFGP